MTNGNLAREFAAKQLTKSTAARASGSEIRRRGLGPVAAEDRNFGSADAGWRGQGYFEFRGAKKNERPVPVPGQALGVLYSVLHGTVWHPYAGER